jgi:hypothetical protein
MIQYFLATNIVGIMFGWQRVVSTVVGVRVLPNSINERGFQVGLSDTKMLGAALKTCCNIR